MPKRLTCLLTVGMILLVSVLCAIAATPGKKPGIRHISEDVPLDGSTAASNRFPSEEAVDRSAVESMSRTSCADINPQAGVIISHDSLGQTWYEMQQNGTIGRMIIIGPDGHRGFSWMSSASAGSWERYVYSKCRSAEGTYHGPASVDNAIGSRPGFVNQGHTYDGRPVLVYHRTQSEYPESPRFCMLAASGFPVIPDYNHRFDLPDSILDAESGEKGMWPRVAVKYDQGEGEDYVHVVVTEASLGGGAQRMMAYQRCYWTSSSWLECQNYVNGSTQTYVMESNQH